MEKVVMDLFDRISRFTQQLDDSDTLNAFCDVVLGVVMEWEATLMSDDDSLVDLEGLSTSQAIAYRKLVDFINSSETWFRLQGYAGTGKSYTVSRFIQYLIKNKIKFCVTAPTHKAVKNLVKMLEGYGLARDKDFDAVTLARLLGKVAAINYEDGKEHFVTKNEVKVTDYKVILVDEFSMVSESSFQEIYDEVYFTSVKVIFIGDAAQLPPVNEKISVVATHPEINCEASLTEIMRYDGDIATVAKQIRQDPKYSQSLFRFFTTPDRTITVLPEASWLEAAVEFFAEEDWLINPDLCRAIAWRNATVSKFNTLFRQRIHGEDVPYFIPSDRLVSRSPLFRWSVLKGDWELIADNREEFTVIGDLEIEKDPIYGWDVYVIKTRSEQGNPVTMQVLTEDSENLRKKRKKEVAAEAKSLKDKGDRGYKEKWKLYFDMEKRFDNVAHALCLTAHSAQGSSIDNVFLYAREMAFCPEKQQILYTSLTRAKSRCVICQ